MDILKYFDRNEFTFGLFDLMNGWVGSFPVRYRDISQYLRSQLKSVKILLLWIEQENILICHI